MRSPSYSLFWIPLLVLGSAFALLEWSGADRAIARAWYFDEATQQWLGTGNGAWWAHGLLHTGGRWFVRAIAAGALVAWALSFCVARARPWRESAGFVALSMIATTTLIGGLKAITNVDCPWDLDGFGGTHPFVALFADRPDALRRAQCFPGAHASSGFALLCFYFLWRDERPRRARMALLAAIAVGTAFSIGQEARGAHFLSHDLASAGLAWFIQFGLYAWRRRASAPALRAAPLAPVSPA